MTKLGDIIKDTNGKSYKLLKKLGRGGQASVCQVQELGSNKLYAYKSYRANKNDIRENIENLIALGGLKDKNGQRLNTVVLPLAIVPGQNDSFGYIMECVDLKDYTVLKQAWNKNKYPSCEAVCKIVKHLAEFFEALHGSNGMCYKDINEGNIFFNPTTGDVKIIDNDNIGYSDKVTIKGTPNYMAPEVVLGKRNPDQRTDSFSLAVYVFRLLIGGYPFDGEYARTYTIKNDMLDADAAKVIYGSDPVFIWHPTDRRNSIENVSDPEFKAAAKYQAARWKRLPESIKKLFLNTFVENLPDARRAERASDAKWLKVFTELEKNLRACPKCRKKTFGESEECFVCEAKIGKPSATNSGSGTPGNVQPSVQSTAAHSVSGVLISTAEQKKMVALTGKVKGSDISKQLPAQDLLEIIYYPQKNVIGIKNIGSLTWYVVKPNNETVECPPGKQVKAEVDVKIAFIRKQVQLNVQTVK
ncbi:MAG: hypothetical protein MJ050_01325 [Phascolarctobacterium sp.]|nr:hypothetical protein [Phascolarctobacterium sp.]